MYEDFTAHLSHPVFKVIKKYLEDKDYAFVIGGFVRDLLRENKSKDIDIVVDGDVWSSRKTSLKFLGLKKCLFLKTLVRLTFGIKI